MSDTYPFTTDTRMARQMADGHRMRHGHKLTGRYVLTTDAGIVKLIRTCCEEES
jgi:hypothetical protein